MKTVSDDILNKIIKIVKDGGGEVYEKPGYVNFCGVRNNVTNDTFNDTLYIYWKEGNSFKGIYTNEFTTKPGKKIVLNTNGNGNPNGAAILKEGWQKDIWHIGEHKPDSKNGHLALRSSSGVTKPTKITRDKTQYGKKSSNYELRIFNNNTYSGHFGVNFHRSSIPNSNNVNGWSAGCQVFKYEKDFNEMLNLAQNASNKGQKKFSYFLVNKTVLDEQGVVNNGGGTPYTSTNLNVSSSSSTTSSGSYGGCGGVSQLGNFSNAPDAQTVSKHNQNREDVLNTLVGGSYTPKQVKKCSELITSDKKKNVKADKTPNK